MLPKWHILFGVIFSLVLYFFFNVSFFNSLIVFLSSVLIDFDHYLFYAKRKKDWSLKNAYNWNKKLINTHKLHKPIMHIFHTLEFLFLVFILIYFWQGFLFIFLGIFFHSVIDVLEMIYKNKLHYREFSLIRYCFQIK